MKWDLDITLMPCFYRAFIDLVKKHSGAYWRMHKIDKLKKNGKRKTSISTGAKIVRSQVCLAGPHCFYMFHKIDQKCPSNL